MPQYQLGDKAPQVDAGADGQAPAALRRFAGAHPAAFTVFGAVGRAAEEARRRYAFDLGAR